MRRNRGIAGIAVVIVAAACAGCAASSTESTSLSGNDGAPVAISATPRTLTWKKPAPTATPHATPTATATHGTDETAQQALSAAMAPLADDDDDHVAVAVDDLSTGQSASYAGTQEFITASIVKADILSTRLYQLQQAGSQLSSGEEALAVAMIENSDNTAASDLYDDDGEATGIDDANQVFGLTETTVGTDGLWGLTHTTADDQLKLLRLIFTSASPLSPDSRSYIQDLMGEVETDQQWGVPAAADSGTSFQVKNGWLNSTTENGLWEINSIGHVTHDGQSMLIAVLSSYNDSEADGISEIERVVDKAADAVADTTPGAD
jgi:beta-lactamase class A